MKDFIYTAYWNLEWPMLEWWVASGEDVEVLVTLWKSIGMVISF